MKHCKVVIGLSHFQERKPTLREAKQFGKLVKTSANPGRKGAHSHPTPLREKLHGLGKVCLNKGKGTSHSSLLPDQEFLSKP